MIRIGTQTFGLFKEFDADFAGTIKTLHDIGFNCIEPLVLFQEKQKNTPKKLWTYELLKKAKPILDSYGMSIPSVHVYVGMGFFTMPSKQIVTNLIRLHEEFGIDNFVLSGMFRSKIVAKKWGKLANKVAKALKPYECTILYHNHDDEFATIKVNEKTITAMDYFLELAGPDVKLQLDIGWAAVAGDECIIAEKYADRIVEVHFKDFYKEFLSGDYNRSKMTEKSFSPVGEGAVKSEAVVKMCHKFPNFNGALLLDQDKYTGDMMDAMRIGYKNLSSY